MCVGVKRGRFFPFFGYKLSSELSKGVEETPVKSAQGVKRPEPCSSVVIGDPRAVFLSALQFFFVFLNSGPKGNLYIPLVIT